MKFYHHPWPKEWRVYNHYVCLAYFNKTLNLRILNSYWGKYPLSASKTAIMH